MSSEVTVTPTQGLEEREIQAWHIREYRYDPYAKDADLDMAAVARQREKAWMAQAARIAELGREIQALRLQQDGGAPLVDRTFSIADHLHRAELVRILDSTLDLLDRYGHHSTCQRSGRQDEQVTCNCYVSQTLAFRQT